jgi:hypothetical protein
VSVVVARAATDSAGMNQTAIATGTAMAATHAAITQSTTRTDDCTCRASEMAADRDVDDGAIAADGTAVIRV